MSTVSYSFIAKASTVLYKEMLALNALSRKTTQWGKGSGQRGLVLSSLWEAFLDPILYATWHSQKTPFFKGNTLRVLDRVKSLYTDTPKPIG